MYMYKSKNINAYNQSQYITKAYYSILYLNTFGIYNNNNNNLKRCPSWV